MEPNECSVSIPAEQVRRTATKLVHKITYLTPPKKTRWFFYAAARGIDLAQNLFYWATSIRRYFQSSVYDQKPFYEQEMTIIESPILDDNSESSLVSELEVSYREISFRAAMQLLLRDLIHQWPNGFSKNQS